MQHHQAQNDFRRKWEKDEYEHLAQKRITEEREKKDGKLVPPVKLAPLQSRDYKVDLASKVGRTSFITKTTPQAELGGHYCNVCHCAVKAPYSFLEHIKGKRHQRNLGMRWGVDLSSWDEVKKRFEFFKKTLEEKKKDDFEERMKKLREEAQNDFRHKWQKDEYEHLAQKRITEEREKKDGKLVPPVKLAPLQPRDYKVDLESKVGRTSFITKTTPQAEMGGHYCNVCHCAVEASISFLEHIKDKRHQRNLGMRMGVELSSWDQVKKRFEFFKKKLEEKKERL